MLRRASGVKSGGDDACWIVRNRIRRLTYRSGRHRRRFLSWWIDHFQLYARGSRSEHFNLSRSGHGEIDDAAFDERTSIVDPHANFFSVVEIGDLDPCLKWKRAMRGGELLHIEDLT